jgi:Ca2+-binding EF-hand superfamily protein
MSDLQLDLGNDDIIKTFNVFDINSSGEIDFNEFIKTLKGDVNDFRKFLIEKRYNDLDKNKNGFIPLSTFTAAFNPRAHPDIVRGRSEDAIYLEFLENWEKFHQYYLEKNGNFNNANMVTKEEWVDYFETLSIGVAGDNDLEAILNSFRLQGRDTGRERVVVQDNRIEDSYKASPKRIRSTSNRPADSNILNQAHLKYLNNNTNIPVSKSTTMCNNRYHDIPTLKSNNIMTTSVDKHITGGTVDYDSRSMTIPTEKSTKEFLEIVRGKIVSKGVRNLIVMNRQFRQYDVQNKAFVDYHRFCNILRELYGDVMVRQEIDDVFKFFDFRNSGIICYEEFLYMIKGDISPARKRLVLTVFNQLDSDRKGFIHFDELKERYIVQEGLSTREMDEYYNGFIEAFEFILSNRNQSRKDKVFFENFLEYYTYVSCTNSNDSVFNGLINTSWRFGKTQKPLDHLNHFEVNDKLNNSVINKYNLGNNYQPRNPIRLSARTRSNEVSPEKINKEIKVENSYDGSDSDTISTIRSVIISRGVTGIFAFIESLRAHDLLKTGVIDKIDFKKSLLLQRLSFGINDDEVDRMASAYDIHRVGKVNHEGLIKSVLGDMNNLRRSLVRRLFNKFVKQNRTYIEVDEFILAFNPTGHPDIVNKSDEQIFGDFLHLFETYYASLHKGKAKIRTLSFDELYPYFNILSISIPNEQIFTNFIELCWNI